MPKSFGKFERGHPQQGCQLQVGYTKIYNFWRTSLQFELWKW